MNIKLSEIFIGYSNGDEEAKKDNFIKLFYNKNNIYNTLMNDKCKFVISGQKGTGKTILGRYIEVKNNDKCMVCKFINKDILKFQKLLEVGCKNLDRDEYEAFIKWVTFREMSRCIIYKNISFKDIEGKNLIVKMKNYVGYKRNKKKLASLFNIRYPKGNFKSDEYVKSEELSSSMGIEDELTKFKSLTNTKQQKTLSYHMKKYYEILPEIEMIVLECIKFVNIILIFDDLDELQIKFCDKQSEIQMLIELIYTIKKINDNISQISNKNSRCILLIRSDILKELNKCSANLNKILSDGEINLNWIDKHYTNPYDNTLMDMILNKIKLSCTGFKDKTNQDIYRDLFPESVDNKNFVNYLLDYSFGRPRDFITYLRIIINKNPNSTSITSNMVAEAKSDYSKNFRNELYNELCIHFKSEYVDDLFQILTDMKQRSFDLKYIDRFYKINKGNYTNIKNINKAIGDMYKFGIIGNMWRAANGKTYYSWAYRNDGTSQVDLQKKFTIHYALRKNLLL